MMLSFLNITASRCSKLRLSAVRPYQTLHTLKIDSGRNVFLHGLLGNGKNLKTLAKRFGGGILVDLRGHGQSICMTKDGENTFEQCANDVLKSTQEYDFSTIIGHSFGGRVALECAVQHANAESKNMKTLWLLDTVPGQAHESVDQVLHAVEAVGDLQKCKTRANVAELLEEQKLDKSLAQWLTTSMTTDSDGSMMWGFDVNMVKDIMPHFGTQDFLGKLKHLVLSEETSYRVHLVRGGKNSAWSIDILSNLHELSQKSNRFHLHVLPKAGHWVHVDDLPGLSKLWNQFQA
mmetsp:Transcript_7730/g.11814  ORF Transcript_7730/g.11814 Transcript_7730/m.11814 type:complete len:291 (-) Transcript_7730:1111-1983(-)